MGPGVYLTSLVNAFTIGKCRGYKGGVAVFEVRVNLERCKDYGAKTSKLTNWLDEYDSARALHPPWAGIKTEFCEWVVSDSSKCRVYGLHLINAKVDDDIDLPRGKVYLNGSCRINGNINAAEIVE